ncbi:lytic transglycosylase domain-containing protein [Conexibacter sp. W3-3-2]|uniref:lytic transglycosylase domain-containing protein n=1 Tax=Conexibacter sp. W3-3-2 TaxID=2675227 RepID=UPI002816909E|nr:lytic transglycosylase domain-containing protein [Conexibacter sp. W3-3-2]
MLVRLLCLIVLPLLLSAGFAVLARAQQSRAPVAGPTYPALEAPRGESREETVRRLSVPNGPRLAAYVSRLQPATPCGDIAQLRPAWVRAARLFELEWRLLAAITKVESGYGCNMGPSSAGAIGWTQFLPSTWERWGMDGDGDGSADPANSVDAIFSTARYLRVTGAPGDVRKALFAYNHADWYVRKVLATAEQIEDIPVTNFEDAARSALAFARAERDLRRAVRDLRVAQRRVARLDRRLRRADRGVQGLRRSAGRAARRARGLQQRVDALTQELQELTATLSADQQVHGDPDTLALELVSGVDLGQATLVYAVAGSLVQRRVRLARELSADASAAALERDRRTVGRDAAVADRADLAVSRFSLADERDRASRAAARAREARRRAAGAAREYEDSAAAPARSSPLLPGRPQRSPERARQESSGKRKAAADERRRDRRERGAGGVEAPGAGPSRSSGGSGR